MSALPFFKMSGSGNDFVFLDGRLTGPDEWPPERIAAVCARRTGVGADGFVILEPPRPDRPGPAIRFHYFNADGNRSDMCGNASLCAARLAVRLGMAPDTDLTLITDVGDLKARRLPGPDERAQIDLPDVAAPTRPAIEPGPGERAILQYLVGIPHVVVLVDDVDATAADPMGRGRAIRSHAAVGKAGANANFVASTSGGGWRYRTFERGVEAETLACGTGAVAVAAALKYLGRCEPHVIDLETSSGKILSVGGHFGSDGGVQSPTLAGEGRIVYSGELPGGKL